MNNDKRWITVVEYYDRENGEQITKSLAQREYVIIKKFKTTREDERYKYSVWNYECERNRQQTLNL